MVRSTPANGSKRNVIHPYTGKERTTTTTGKQKENSAPTLVTARGLSRLQLTATLVKPEWQVGDVTGEDAVMRANTMMDAACSSVRALRGPSSQREACFVLVRTDCWRGVACLMLCDRHSKDWSRYEMGLMLRIEVGFLHTVCWLICGLAGPASAAEDTVH